MRIVGGEFRGRMIDAPSGQKTRPTTDRVRESLFNILAHGADFELAGARVLDLFAGSGALGFEAISRGASFCLFVDTDAAARGAIRNNVEGLGLFGNTRIHRRPAEALGTKPVGVGNPFSLVFMDPPYGKGLVEPTLVTLADGAWLVPGALIIAEHEKEATFTLPPDFQLQDRRSFGGTEMSFIIAPAA